MYCSLHRMSLPSVTVQPRFVCLSLITPPGFFKEGPPGAVSGVFACRDIGSSKAATPPEVFPSDTALGLHIYALNPSMCEVGQATIELPQVIWLEREREREKCAHLPSCVCIHEVILISVLPAWLRESLLNNKQKSVYYRREVLLP